MGKFYKLTYHFVGLFCASALAFQALAADRPSVTIDANTGRVTTTPQTYQVPRGATLNVQQTNLPATVSQGNMNVPVVSRVNPPAGRGFDAHSLFKLNTSALRNSVSRCLTSFRCNLALSAGAQGLQSLLDGVDWVMTEGATGQPVIATAPGFNPDFVAPSYTDGVAEISNLCQHVIGSSGGNPCGGMSVVKVLTNQHTGKVSRVDYCPSSYNSQPLVGVSSSFPYPCQYSAQFPLLNDASAFTEPEPVTPSDIDNAIHNSYVPHASDWPFLSGGVDLGDDGITIEGDFLELPEPEVITESLPDGTTRRTTTTVEPEWYDNPSHQPGIEFTSYTEVTIFNEYGDIFSNETTSITSGRGGGGGGSAGPIDCDFMPTVCRFINWFTEPDPELSQEPDLKQLMETFDPDESSYDFGPDTMACPEPYTIAFSLLPSVEVSLQPICDVVDRVRPLVLALAYIFSGILLVRNI